LVCADRLHPGVSAGRATRTGGMVQAYFDRQRGEGCGPFGSNNPCCRRRRNVGPPLADVTFEDGVGLVFGSNLSLFGSVTLPISDLSSDLTVKNFIQFANIALQPNAFYAIDVFLGRPKPYRQATVGWGTTAEDSGPGVEEGYNASIIRTMVSFQTNRLRRPITAVRSFKWRSAASQPRAFDLGSNARGARKSWVPCPSPPDRARLGSRLTSRRFLVAKPWDSILQRPTFDLDHGSDGDTSSWLICVYP
jgi:hypothetical protein